MKGRVRLDSRSIVYMASGAALYGVLSWLTNVLHLPSASLISVRPAIVIPIFFGFAWGPAVGFFAGGVGNLIGDTLTGWGFYPQWCLGNGIVGLVAGASHLLGRGRRATTSFACLVIVLLGGVALLMRKTREPLGAGFLPEGFVPAEHFAWPLGIAALVAGILIYGRVRARRLPPERVGESTEALLWGVLGIAAGMLVSSLIDIRYNAMTFEAAMIGEFLPATVANVSSLVVLLPPLTRAFERALDRAGR